MRIKPILLFIVLLTSCKTQQPIIIEANISNELEPGVCYFSILKDEGMIKEKSFVLEIVPPQYKEVEVKYSEKELEDHKNGNGKYLFQTKMAHHKFVMKNTNLSNFTIEKKTIGYKYCMIEVPAEYRTISKEELSSNGNTITETMLVRSSKIIKKYVDKRPKKLKANQYFFEEGYWTELRKAIFVSY